MSASSYHGSALVNEELAGLFHGENGAWVEALYEDYVLGRESVPESWRRLFDRVLGRAAPADEPAPAARAAVPADAVVATNGQDRRAAPATAGPAAPVVGIVGLVDAYRSQGHLIAKLDPLGHDRDEHPLLDPATFGLGGFDPTRRIQFGNYLGAREGTLPELIASLRRTYCRTFGVEFADIRDKERRDWLIENMEPRENRPELTTEERLRTLTQIMAAERFEQFLHKRFLGVYRFSLEGGESLIPVMDTLFEGASERGAEDAVIAMAHRGRLNVMAHAMDMPYRAIMAEFQQSLMPANASGAGDVKYHRGFSADRRTRAGKSLHLSLCPNPSHLEWINPVAEGVVAAKQQRRGDLDGLQVIPVQIH